MDFENFHNVYENQQKCLIYMFWVELRGSEKLINLSGSYGLFTLAASLSTKISWILVVKE